MSFCSTQNENRLVLGTAQLGMEYGIANKTGKPNLKIAEQIIQTAWENGIREFDTAQSYGESEDVLGKVSRSLGISNEVKIISKLHPNLDHLNQIDLSQAMERTLSNSRIPRLYCVMLHREEFLDLWDKGLGEILLGFVRSGLVEHLGVSVYSPDKAIQAISTEGIAIVQFPSNLLDRRFERAGVFQLAEDNGKQIHVRSIFLQGLLLMDSKDVPANMQFAFAVLKRLESLTKEKGLSKHDLVLGYAKQAYPKAKIIFGVETIEQVKENLESWGKALPQGFIERAQDEFRCVDERILNPILWSN